MLYCFQDMGTGALMFSREGNLDSNVFRRNKLVHLYWCTTVLEKKIGALLFKEKGTAKWCSTDLRRKELMH